MIEVFVIELMNLLKDKCSHREEPKVKEEKKYKKPHEEFLEQIEAEMERLDGLKKHISFHQDNLRMLHKVVSDALRKANKSEPDADKQSQSPEPPENEENAETEGDQLNMDVPEPNLTETERLEMLEGELNYTVNTLFNTKMAHRFKELRQLLAELAELANTEDMPNHQREKTIEAELRKAIDILGESSCASRSKVTIDLRGHLVDLLNRINA